MKVLGIIAEYNPFHNGHAYHLSRSKEITGADITVAVMSGNFVQRGEPALLDKWTRSNTAVHNGVDLVLELPFVYACNNAELFARGAVGILNGLGCVDNLSFGSEAGNIEVLSEIVEIIEPESEEFSNLLREKLSEGISYAAAREETIAHYLGSDKAAVAGSPNNILGIEYLKQLKSLNSRIKPVTIKRQGASPDEVNAVKSIAGATALRNMIGAGDIEGVGMYMPETAFLDLYSSMNVIADIEKFKEMIFYSIISKSGKELANIYSITEGLENRVAEAAKISRTTRELIERIKSKRYAETRVRRILMHILLDLRRDMMLKILKEEQLYARVLAFNERGSALIKTIKKEKSSIIPMITNIVKEAELFEKAVDVFSRDLLASDIYNLATAGDIDSLSEYRRIPAFVK